MHSTLVLHADFSLQCAAFDAFSSFVQCGGSHGCRLQWPRRVMRKTPAHNVTQDSVDWNETRDYHGAKC
eukprot:6484642-Amphidinium_carterae.1